MNIFRGLCSHFFNVAQDFVTNLEEASILHDLIDSAPTKLEEYRESNRRIIAPTDVPNLVTHDECPIGVDELRGSRRVTTRGRPATTRLGASRDKSVKKVLRKRKNTSHILEEPDCTEEFHHNNVASSSDYCQSSISVLSDSLQVPSGSFTSLLKSFQDYSSLY
ncbi:hypothetical protein PIB30_026931 [Stylosanthes scabra]|uniref:Uncharacterized protein n=1 Tax=Stylosanthes scabra TaxID=79078 RepID=A0ABU6Y8V1_9FABA|nr:hypothetical protein [Stylosanthes scabra]